VVFDEAEFSKFVHEDIHARARSTDYFRQSLLGNNWRFVVRLVLRFSISIATTATLPDALSTENFTLPFRMYMTLLAARIYFVCDGHDVRKQFAEFHTTLIPVQRRKNADLQDSGFIHDHCGGVALLARLCNKRYAFNRKNHLRAGRFREERHIQSRKQCPFRRLVNTTGEEAVVVTLGTGDFGGKGALGASPSEVTDVAPVCAFGGIPSLAPAASS